MATVRMWTLVGLALLCTMLTVQADDDATPGPGGEHGKDMERDGDDHFGYKHDKDDDGDDDDDCEDHDDDDKDDHGRKGDDMHKEGDKDGKHKEDGKEEHNEHSKNKRCRRKKIAKILIIVGLGIVVIGTGVGVVICCVRHKRQMRRNVTDSRTNLHVPGARENVYIVTDTKPQQEKPSVLAFPVVSHAPLPGKE
ncbi:pheromone-processing carboxypeptidase KEX1-like [Mizuhopecten yessoensis]|uniref:pheromone-processing carboxypeptidase KEX1-like n=1 Tax=Mizuhopecten yessoensis TaxID=6573 RepID=UPI000B458239|nr:pheromone-processing carboxypeptidase KEX1-like [Mizuhopecten yessoensis]